jgi:hypothetical protein
VNSPALATETLIASGPNSAAGEIGTVERRARPARAVWFLVGWLVMSATIIAIAGIVVGRYF